MTRHDVHVWYIYVPGTVYLAFKIHVHVSVADACGLYVVTSSHKHRDASLTLAYAENTSSTVSSLASAPFLLVPPTTFARFCQAPSSKKMFKVILYKFFNHKEKACKKFSTYRNFE